MNPDDFDKNHSINMDVREIKVDENCLTITKSQSEWQHLNDLLDIADNVLKLHGYTALAEKLRNNKIQEKFPYNITFTGVKKDD